MMKRATILAAVAGLLVLGACAAARENRITGRPDALTIAINNNVRAGASITVYLVPRTGTRVLLATIAPAREVLLVYPGGGPRLEEYRLVALVAGDSDIRSPWFAPYSRGTVVRWDVSSNNLSVWAAEPEGEGRR